MPSNNPGPAPDSKASFLLTTLRCRCPRCGIGRLYKNLLEIRPACGSCGLDFRQVDTGDGAAAGVIMVLGAFIVALAFWVEFRFNPPLWVHAILWPVVTIPLAIWLIRLAKAALIAQQYRYRSSEMGL
ncbi:DUF983 domain-containing protein [Rhodopila sp.]|uniref:DUF983 domain-containing protein n=1 Tax=Rhodopila sp. TaxID=2480087 RepID=UPI003D10DDB5